MAEMNKASHVSSEHETVGKLRSGNATGRSLPIAISQLPDPTSRFDLQRKIGEGTYGTVYRSMDRTNDELVAIKQVKKAHELVEEIEIELAILEEFAHENLPKFYGAFLQKLPSDDVLWIAMELCENGSVSNISKHLVRTGTRFTDPQIAYILHETLRALEFLHSRNVIHRDVKGKNVLLTNTCAVKLIDFGISCKINSASKEHTSIGTPYWIAPEVILCGDAQTRTEGYDTRADIWGVGILTFELVIGNSPFAGISVPKALKKIIHEEPPILNDANSELSGFVAACLTKDYQLRPVASKLLEDNFIKKHDDQRDSIRQELTEMCTRLKPELADDKVDREQTKVWNLRTDSCKNIENAQVHIGRKPQNEVSAVDAKKQQEAAAAKKRQAELNIDDLSKLAVLDEPTMLAALKLRYETPAIYSYVGDILVALNPFTPIPIYNDRVAEKYKQTVVDAAAAHRKSALAPHIYAVALKAYEAMMHSRDHQCIVINGESGAGKTESAKHTVAHLVRLGSAQNKNLEERILQTGPLLEAFGNSKTVIHQNSSRFGKYLEMIFSSSGKILGARMNQYLLEKSRVVKIAREDETFHIFYYLFDAFCSKDRSLATFNLDPYTAYRYLGGMNRVISTKQREENFWRFQTVKRSLETIGFGEQDSQAIFAAIAAIIHAGNLNFEQIDVGGSSNSGCKLENRYLLNLVSSLLAVNMQELCDALTTTTFTARTDTIIRQNNVEEAQALRDALAKTLYSRLFSWIVMQINQMLKPTRPFYLVNSKQQNSLNEMSEDPDGIDASVDCTLIGILDIFGFENFPVNSFEQLCINITNEQLQYYFNQHIFALELEEMQAEGVELDADINFSDNRPVLDTLLGKPLGVLTLLDEESNFPKATDLSLIQKLVRNVTSEYFVRQKSDNAMLFAVQHYAGRVEYDVHGFIEKNRDWLPNQISEVMRRSEIPLIRSLFGANFVRSASTHGPPHGSGAMHMADGFQSSFTSGLPSAMSTPSLAFTSGIHSNASSIMASKLHSGQSSVGSFSVASRVSQSRAQQTMAAYFRNSLVDLLTKMVACQPHFVRCVRPNLANEVRVFDESHVLRQLRYCGLLETIRIRQKGYSHRFAYDDFVEKYRVLLMPSRMFHEALGIGDSMFDNEFVYKRFAQSIVDKIGLKNYRLGRTKLFLKHYHIGTLMERFEALQRKIVRIQSLIRGFLFRRRQQRDLINRSRNAIIIQKYARRFLARRRYLDELDRRAWAAVIITKCVRGYLVQKHYFQMLEDRLVETQCQMQAVRRHRFRSSARPEHEGLHLLSNLANSTLFLRAQFARQSYKRVNPRARQPSKLEPIKSLVSTGSMDTYDAISSARRDRRVSNRCMKHAGMGHAAIARYYSTIAELKRQTCNSGSKPPAASNVSTPSSGVYSNATTANSLSGKLPLPAIVEERRERFEKLSSVEQKQEEIERILSAVDAAKVLLSNKPVTRVNLDSPGTISGKTCLEILLNAETDRHANPPQLHHQHLDLQKPTTSHDDHTHLRRQNTVKQHEHDHEHEHEHEREREREHDFDDGNQGELGRVDSNDNLLGKMDHGSISEPPAEPAPFLNFVPNYLEVSERERRCDDLDSFIDDVFDFDEEYRRFNKQHLAA